MHADNICEEGSHQNDLEAGIAHADNIREEGSYQNDLEAGIAHAENNHATPTRVYLAFFAAFINFAYSITVVVMLAVERVVVVPFWFFISVSLILRYIVIYAIVRRERIGPETCCGTMKDELAYVCATSCGYSAIGFVVLYWSMNFNINGNKVLLNEIIIEHSIAAASVGVIIYHIWRMIIEKFYMR